MAYEYQLSLTNKETGETVSLVGKFEEVTWNLLSEFLQYAEDLLNTKFVRNGMHASLNLKWERGKDMQVSSELPDWDEVIIFLHKYRPIGLQSEGTNFYRICGILAKEFQHPYLRNMIGDQRDIYSGKRMQSMFRVQSDDVVLNSEKMLNDWLNAFEYHRDHEKQKFIESLHQMFPLEASKVLFLSLLSNRTQAILNLAVIIRVVLGKQRSFEGYVAIPTDGTGG